MQTARVTAVIYKDGGEACREMRECGNPHALAFPLWICVRLNFSRGERQGAIGHSVNVSGSEQPEPRQPYAVACHSLCLCLAAVCCLLSPLFPWTSVSFTLPHFYYCLLHLPHHCWRDKSTSGNRQFASFSQNLRWTQIHLQPFYLTLLCFREHTGYVWPSFISS